MPDKKVVDKIVKYMWKELKDAVGDDHDASAAKDWFLEKFTTSVNFALLNEDWDDAKPNVKRLIKIAGQLAAVTSEIANPHKKDKDLSQGEITAALLDVKHFACPDGPEGRWCNFIEPGSGGEAKLKKPGPKSARRAKK